MFPFLIHQSCGLFSVTGLVTRLSRFFVFCFCFFIWSATHQLNSDLFSQNTIAGRMAYFPAVGRLDCGSSSLEHHGFWQLNGYGLLAIYKSDWDRFGGEYNPGGKKKENRLSGHPAVTDLCTVIKWIGLDVISAQLIVLSYVAFNMLSAPFERTI